MKQPTILRDAENENGADETATSKRKQVSKRSFLEGEKIEEAKGARYTLLDPNGNHDIDYTFGANSEQDRMFALFGFHTKIGNVANTVLNDKDEPGSPSDAAASIREFMTQLAGGTWAERAAGGGGQKIDKAALAGSIVAVLLASGKITQEQADDTYAEKLKRLEEEPAYVRTARAVDAVAQEYAKRVGKPQKTVADL